MNSPVPRVAAVHDLSGFGRSSLTVVIPVLSTMGIQVCPLPTAVLSTHTGGFKDYKFIDLTEHLTEYIAHWQKLGIKFDSIYSGFLGSIQQIDIVADFIKKFSTKEQLVVIDPVLGDNGKTYGPFGPDMIKRMKGFIGQADIITPNLTEALFLLDEDYREDVNKDEIKEWLMQLANKGPQIVIITSVTEKDGDKTSVIAYNKNDGRFWKVDCDFIPADFPGTGDTFTSVVVGSILKGDSLPLALDRAVQFISIAVRTTYGYDYPEREGVMLERVLDNLKSPIISHSYEIF